MLQTHAPTEAIHRSRRAVLTAALGAAAATVMGALGKPRPVRGAGDDGQVINVGDSLLDVQATTNLANSANNNTVLYCASNSNLGFGAGAGVFGYSALGHGLRGHTGSGRGVSGYSSGAGVGTRGESVNGIGVLGYSTSVQGVVGTSAGASGVGVQGSTGSGTGVYGSATSGVGVLGTGQGRPVFGDGGSSGYAAVTGRALAGTTGVLGYSGADFVPNAKAKTGVFGVAKQDTNSRGVWGYSPAGHGIHGSTDTGFAGYFDGKVYTTKWYELAEISNPAAPLANRARIFVRDSAGNTQLCVRFPNGGIKVLATES